MLKCGFLNCLSTWLILTIWRLVWRNFLPLISPLISLFLLFLFSLFGFLLTRFWISWNVPLSLFFFSFLGLFHFMFWEISLTFSISLCFGFVISVTVFLVSKSSFFPCFLYYSILLFYKCNNLRYLDILILECFKFSSP